MKLSGQFPAPIALSLMDKPQVPVRWEAASDLRLVLVDTSDQVSLEHSSPPSVG
jgi:hypothetical protein